MNGALYIKIKECKNDSFHKRKSYICLINFVYKFKFN